MYSIASRTRGVRARIALHSAHSERHGAAINTGQAGLQAPQQHTLDITAGTRNVAFKIMTPGTPRADRGEKKEKRKIPKHFNK